MSPLQHPPFKPRARHKRRHAARHHARVLTAVAVLSLGSASLARAQASPPRALASATQAARAETTAARAARWKASFEQFDAADRAQAPPPGGVLFVGSSSIRLWDSLDKDFDKLPVVIKRGFGGSRLSDCTDHLTRLVLPYRPRLVIVYAGDNDLAEGATPDEVLDSYKRFVQGVRAELPDTRIAYLSIKPSPRRVALLEQVRATNELIRAHSASLPNTDYIDVFSRMLGPDGRPRPELFGTDMLHLNRAGYALWTEEVSRHLGPVAPAVDPNLADAAPPRAVP
jgi:lysophospholipase L1-like esterase